MIIYSKRMWINILATKGIGAINIGMPLVVEDEVYEQLIKEFGDERSRARDFEPRDSLEEAKKYDVKEKIRRKEEFKNFVAQSAKRKGKKGKGF